MTASLPSAPPPRSGRPSWAKILSALALGAALLTVLVWRLWPEVAAPRPPARQDTAPVVSLAGPRLIAVQPGSLLERKLEIAAVRRERLTTPLVTVTGSVTARLRPGPEPLEQRWQFSSVELSGIYADWQKARTEVEFAAKQLAKTRELTATQLSAQNRAVERLRRLVATGTEAIRDLTAAEATALETQLEGQKAVFEAESALTQATHSHADLERRLLQAGVDPALLQKIPPGAALVMADVPEVRIELVAAGQSCEARFYGLPEQRFRGIVRSLAPALSPERRTLRVFFELNDEKGRLKPGMYAEIGLGTDPRTSILAPADGVLHIGERDYVLTAQDPGVWRVTEVRVGERAGEQVEILEGLEAGQRLVGTGAILLKPLAVKALLEAGEAPARTGEARQ